MRASDGARWPGRPSPARVVAGSRLAAGCLALAMLVLTILAGIARAEDLAFPELTGRVVDAADVLTPGQRADLSAKLKAHEDRTSDQVVVATVPSLHGITIEDYGNRLFRAWKLGQAKANNGALLLVAPAERKVRIEVGYGLEGALTDALSRVIIASAITPRFKAGDLYGGIDAGVDGMLAVLSRDASEQKRAPQVRQDAAGSGEVVVFVVLLLIVVFVIARANRGRGGGWVFLPSPGSGGWSGGYSGGGSSDGSGGGFSGGGSSGGGFSGGGGSSGGGGASGGW